MTDRELMQQALDSLEGYARNCRCEGNGGLCDAGKALKARLAQKESEPVAWIDWDEEGWAFLTTESCGVPLYRAPPQREWQGLTDEERAEAWAKTKGDLFLRVPPFSLAIEQALKEKNAA